MTDSGLQASQGIDDRRREGFPGRFTGSLDAQALAGLRFRLSVDDRLVGRLCDFLSTGAARLERLGLRGVVIGLSGGADSVVCAELARRALGAARVHGVTVHLGRLGEDGRVDRIVESARRLGLSPRIVDGRGVREAMAATGGSASPWRPINIDTRAIQSLLFQTADDLGAGVVATSDRSERLLGRYTEHFYGHLAPLAACFKTEVLELVERLGVAGAITETRPGCEDYWFDEDVLGASYEIIDPLLHLFAEKGRGAEDVAREFKISDRQWLTAVRARVTGQPFRVIEQVPSGIREI